MNIKNILFIFIVMSFLCAHCQKKHFLKRELKYFDIDSNEISKKQFSKFLKSKSEDKPYQVISYPSKKVLIQKLILDKDHGVLSNEEYEAIITTLNENSFKPLGKHTLIQFSKRGNIFGNRFDKKYLAHVKKSFSFTNYFVFKKDINVNLDNTQDFKFLIDTNRVIEKMFFRHPYAGCSFVIINNESKEYYSYYGEYSDSKVIEALKKLSRK